MDEAAAIDSSAGLGASDQSPDDLVDGEYRSLSGLAVGGLLLALASPAYFASSTLVVLPLLAIAICIVALRRIDASPDVLTGRWAALVGAVLAVAVLSAGVTRAMVTRGMLAEQSLPVAEAWLDRALAGDVEGAYELTLQPVARGRLPAPDPSAEAEDAPSPQAARAKAVAEYAAGLLVKRLGELGPETPVVAKGGENVRWLRRGRVSLEHRFEVRPESGEPFELALMLERSRPRGDTAGRWRVINSGVDTDR